MALAPLLLLQPLSNSQPSLECAGTGSCSAVVLTGRGALTLFDRKRTAVQTAWLSVRLRRQQVERKRFVGSGLGTLIERERGTVVRMALETSHGIGADVERSRPPFGVLFVCLGNICRSPTAEAVFTYAVKAKGLEDKYKIDSAGTINYHEGDPADARMRAAAIKRGVKLTSISRPIRPSDFSDFDLILAMDRQNYEDIMAAHRNWSNKYSLPAGSHNKVKLMCSYCSKSERDEVPDPYYGGPEGFEKVLDLLEDACGGLLDSLERQEQTLQA